MKKTDNIIKILTCPESKAILLQSMLEEAGIQSFIKNDSSEAFLGVATPFTDLYIMESDLDKVQHLIPEIKRFV